MKADRSGFDIQTESYQEEPDGPTFYQTRLRLYVPTMVVSYVSENEEELDEQIKRMKRQLLNKLMAELLGAEDWYEKD